MVTLALTAPIIPQASFYLFAACILFDLVMAVLLFSKLQAIKPIVYWYPVMALLTGAIGYSGFLAGEVAFKPFIFPIIALPIFAIIIYAISGKVDAVLKQISWAWLILPQAVRIPIELVLADLYAHQVIPVQMSFHGRNFDIVAGFIGLLLGLYLIRGKVNTWLIGVAQVISLGLLINIVVIAVLSAPSPLRLFMNEPANTMIGFFPMILLPSVAVSFAAVLHALALRKWWLGRNS